MKTVCLKCNRPLEQHKKITAELVEAVKGATYHEPILGYRSPFAADNRSVGEPRSGDVHERANLGNSVWSHGFSHFQAFTQGNWRGTGEPIVGIPAESEGA